MGRPGRAVGSGGDPAHLDGQRRHPGRIRPDSAASGELVRSPARDRLRRRRHRRPHVRRADDRGRGGCPGRVDLPLRGAVDRRRQGAAGGAWAGGEAMKPDFSKGLVPAVVQDADTGLVLMLAYMDEESWSKTRETGRAWFHSRTRGLWEKGSTSGNTMEVIETRLDCDADTVLLRVKPSGPACHTGEVSCFFNLPD